MALAITHALVADGTPKVTTADWNAGHVNTGTLDVANGGTGLAAYAIGDLPYASGTTALSKRAAVAVGSVLASAGVGVAPVWSASPTLTALTLVDVGFTRVADGGGSGTSLVIDQSLKLPALANGPFFGAGFAGIAYRITGEAFADPALIIRAHGYAFENASAAWLGILHNDGGGFDGCLGLGIRSTDTPSIAADRLHIRRGGIRLDNDVAGAAYSRIEMISGALDITTSANNIYLRPTTGADYWIVHSSHHILTSTDNTMDIGSVGANRPRNGYFAGTLSFGTRTAIGAETVTGYITITDAGGTSRKLAVVS